MEEQRRDVMRSSGDPASNSNFRQRDYICLFLTFRKSKAFSLGVEIQNIGHTYCLNKESIWGCVRRKNDCKLIWLKFLKAPLLKTTVLISFWIIMKYVNIYRVRGMFIKSSPSSPFIPIHFRGQIAREAKSNGRKSYFNSIFEYGMKTRK